MLALYMACMPGTAWRLWVQHPAGTPTTRSCWVWCAH